MKSSLAFVTIALHCLTPCMQAANILFFFGVSTYSHRITAWPLVEALADRGHKVTFFQSAPNKNPNPKIEELVVTPTESIGTMDFLAMRLKLGAMMDPLMITLLPELGAYGCRETLNDPVVMKWINSNKVDLVVIDALYNDCALGLAHKWGAQVALFGTSTVFEWWPDDFGFLPESNWIPGPHLAQNLPMSFLGRVVSTLGRLFARFTKIVMLYPKLDPLLREKLNMPDMPSLAQLNSNVSLILMNTHFSEELPRSLPPFIIPVGGMHCTEKTEPLPKAMEEFINGGGKEGFIYVSFGSEVKIAQSTEIRDAFFNAFRNTKMRIVWKWDGERPADMPPNVFTAPWVPQQSILAHPKIRLFITHGGLLSIQEALFHPVPMISFPVFAEQAYNAERLHRTKRGIRMDITKLTQKDLEDAINTVLTDSTYANNVKAASRLFKDRPQRPLDAALWWVEYILRNKNDTGILRPFANQNWFQRRSLDVWAFIFACLMLMLVINMFILKKLFSCCCGRSKTTTVSQKKPKVKKN